MKLALAHVEQKRSKKEAGQSRLVGGRFTKQGKLYTRLVLGDARQVDLCTIHRLLKCVECLTGFSHAFRPNGLNNTLLSLGCVLKRVLVWGWWAEKEVKNLRLPGYIRSYVNHQSPPFNVPLQHLLTKTKVRIKDFRDNPWAPVCPLSTEHPNFHYGLLLQILLPVSFSAPWTSYLALPLSPFTTVTSSQALLYLTLPILTYTCTYKHKHIFQDMIVLIRTF